ncbi:protein of unknown function UPF0157 [Pseudobacteroides cellulosolvens ATCC 35603 = DSM 2933]|uniref:Uncharacterized protein n=1 Tax=Pseudobacteroides cellulosolvens ATCC 35603 = DSM 2933 TaxID=398512 RepID=A0A0L6JKE8_9FIRM|nr:protein of unknown function UPF0157 [Pseudobacteroides cellulosolvens ATCC 35603 = DSM 2933]
MNYILETFLLDHRKSADEYGILKKALKEQYEHNRDGYTEAKTEFILKYTNMARKHYGKRYET